jgi:DNA-binding MarR family transcriptional regulator
MASPPSTQAPNQALRDALVELSFVVHDALTRAAAPLNLSVTQLRLLGILTDRIPAMTAIAEHLGLDRSSVTGLVARAEQRGLVTRTTSVDDARVTLVAITATGRRLMGQIGDTVAADLEVLMAPATATDRHRVVKVVRAVLGARPSPIGPPN